MKQRINSRMLEQIASKETLENLIRQGLVIPEIAEKTGASASAIFRQIERHSLKNLYKIHRITKYQRRLYKCVDCGETDPTKFYKRTKNRCKTCWQKWCDVSTANRKQALVDRKGGKCAICGYNKYLGALEFHHINPSEKEIGLKQSLSKLSKETVEKEIDKCILLCSNCHREVHSNITKLPTEISNVE